MEVIGLLIRIVIVTFVTGCTVSKAELPCFLETFYLVILSSAITGARHGPFII